MAASPHFRPEVLRPVLMDHQAGMVVKLMQDWSTPQGHPSRPGVDGDIADAPVAWARA